GSSSTTSSSTSTSTTTDEATSEESVEAEVEITSETSTTEEESISEETSEATDTSSAEEETSNEFDLEQNDYQTHWAKDYIDKVIEAGIASGVSDDTFAPDQEITRAELVKMMVNASGYWVQRSITEKPFTDVELDAWYAPYIEVAKWAGMIQGYDDGSFRPNAKINRVEAIKILIEGVLKGELILDPTQGLLANFNLKQNPFTDVDLDQWYAKYVLYAYTNSIVSGYGEGMFKPDQSMSRGEFAKVVVEAMGL
ncbi:MAG: amidase, partial [uncultured bacterium]